MVEYFGITCQTNDDTCFMNIIKSRIRIITRKLEVLIAGKDNKPLASWSCEEVSEAYNLLKLAHRIQMNFDYYNPTLFKNEQ